ncbi:MAG: hypothetical protein ABEJ81_05105 [Haloferacaceae archaeon]
MSRRGQFVLAAAVVVAVALVPMAAAYFQLGYPTDAAAKRADTRGLSDARHTLDAATYRAAEGVVAADEPSPTVAAERINRTLSAAVEHLNEAGASHDRVYRLRTNDSTADAVARTDCPDGERRQFGPCRAVDGVVLQERLGAPVVVAVAVDLSIHGPRTTTRVTFVLRPYR